MHIAPRFLAANGVLAPGQLADEPVCGVRTRGLERIALS